MSSTAFVFPGQGSQTVGMLADIAEAYPIVAETFAQASEVLGYDLWALSQEGPQEKLNLTATTQPLLLTASVAIWRIWQENGGVQPAYLAGHSLGEYSALVCAGVLDFAVAVDLVRRRGEFMQTAVPVGVGAMAAVLGVDDEKVVEICTSVSKEDGVVEAVNFNSPGQVVIAGHAEAVAAAGEQLKEAGARRVADLPVSAPFHTSLMRPAGEGLAEVMKDIEFQVPTIPVVHNVHAQAETDPVKIKALMIEQTSSAVKWTQCMQTMVAEGVETVYECGAGKVLSGLAKRIHKPLTAVPLCELAKLQESVSG